MMELKRWRVQLNQPLTLEPAFFPFDANPAAQFIIAALPLGVDAAMQLAGAVMRGCWVEEQNMADGDALATAANACGFDGVALLARSRTAEAAATLEQFNQEAIAAQVFGAPTYIYKGEMFWGQDRLDFLERALRD
jgi:2-hydroxychromene-2-carboxylate isomerase